MARLRYTTLTPTTGLATFPSSVMEDRRFLSILFNRSSPESYVQITDEPIPVSQGTTFRLDHVPRGSASETNILEVWTGPNKSGTKLSYLYPAQSFGAATAREFKHYHGTNEVDVNAAQIANGSLTLVYATYRAACSSVDAETIARIWQELKAVQTAVDSGTGGGGSSADGFSAVAGENLVRGLAYIASTGAVYQMSAANVREQVIASVWVTDSANTGATITVRIGGQVDKPGSITAFPIGKDIRIGRNGLPTWDGDASANKLLSGDFIRFVGHSYDGATLWLNMNVPMMSSATKP